MISKVSRSLAIASLGLTAYFIPGCISQTTVVINGTASHSIPSTLCVFEFPALFSALSADCSITDGMMFEDISVRLLFILGNASAELSDTACKNLVNTLTVHKIIRSIERRRWPLRGT